MFHIMPMTLMNRDNGIDESNNRTKAIAAIPMAGIIVAAALLSGLLSLISSYQQPAIAQQNMTGNATTTGGGGAQSACAPTQSGGGGQNATTSTGGGGNQSTSEVRLHIEEACMAAQNGDMQGVLMHLNLALNALEGGTQGNMTSTTGATNATSTA
jgi:hypothetical protein